MRAVDLHTHTNKSDGSFSPSALVELAAQKNLAAIAITDHDSVDGLDEAMAVSGKYAVEVIPGIEFSTCYGKQDVHMVGLFIDHHKESFTKELDSFIESRTGRNMAMCENLRAAGIDITYEKLIEAFPDSVLTRAHYARYLYDRGYVKSIPEAFDRYVGDRTKYVVPREKITPQASIRMILQGGGIPILAHPPLYHMSSERLDKLVADCKEAGLVGIEALYSSYNGADQRDMRRLATKYDLLLSGGSDFHGTNKPTLSLGNGYGKLFVPEEILDRQKEYLRNRNR